MVPIEDVAPLAQGALGLLQQRLQVVVPEDGSRLQHGLRAGGEEG